MPAASGADGREAAPAAARVPRPLVTAIEIAVVVAVVLAAIWGVPWLVPDRPGQRRIAAVAVGLGAALAVLVHVHRRETPRQLGLRLDNLGPALRAVLPFTLAAGAVLLVLGWVTGGPDGGVDAWRLLRRLPPAILLQQYALQALVHRRLLSLLGQGRRSAAVAAVLFAAVHLPNATLTVATLVSAYAWARAWQRAPNLLATSLSHLALSLALIATLPEALLPDLRVGWSHLRGR